MQPNDQNPVDQTENTLPKNDENTSPETIENQSAVNEVTPTSSEEVSSPEAETIVPTAPETPDVSAEPAVENETVDTPSEEVKTSTEPEVDEVTPAPADNTVAQAAPGAAVAGMAAFAATSSSSADSPKKGKKKLKLLLAAVVVAVILLAGSAAAYFGVILPNQPQKIVGDALTNTVNSEKFKSSKFEGEVSFSGGEVSKMLSSITFEGGADTNNEAVDLKVVLNTAVTKINFDVRTTDGKSLYLKLSGLNGLDQLLAASGAGNEESAAVAQFLPMLTQLNDQWFVIDESLLKQVPGTDSVQTSEKLSNEDAKRVGEIYKKHQFINIDKRLGDQDIHGVASYHVQSTINKDKLKAFLEELKSANIKGLTIEQKDIDSINKVDFSKYPFDVWVSKKDRFVTQLSTTIEEGETKYAIRVALKDINQPVTVEKPANAKSVLELLGGLSQLQGGQQATGNPALLGL